MTRSGFKTSDQVQGQGAGRSRKRSIHGYVSIYRRPATQPLGLRWCFETTSKLKQGFIALLIGISLFWNSPLFAADHRTTITEEACARLEGAEIIWDLSIYRWRCCIPKNEEEYETCIPITDMKPLPKTSPKPFPPNTTKTIKRQNESP